ncbi:hypothetical protein HD554DRAFT_1996563, partial [Boletus coccyginus]
NLPENSQLRRDHPPPCLISPVELLAHVFIECLPPETYLKPDIDSAPLLLTRVCRRWRDVALRTTQLW